MLIFITLHILPSKGCQMAGDGLRGFYVLLKSAKCSNWSMSMVAGERKCIRRRAMVSLFWKMERSALIATLCHLEFAARS